MNTSPKGGHGGKPRDSKGYKNPTKSPTDAEEENYLETRRAYQQEHKAKYQALRLKPSLSTPDLETQPKPVYKAQINTRDRWNTSGDDLKTSTELPGLIPLPKFHKAKQRFKDYKEKHGKGHGLRLARFGIPDSNELLNLFLRHQRSYVSDYGKNIWYYNSPLLRNHVPINMRGRYRGTHPSDNCMKAIDILKLDDKKTEQDRADEQKAHLEGDPYEALKAVAIDEEHFQFLKETADAQLTTLPVTILATLVSDVYPILEDTYRVYAHQFGENNFKTKDVAKSYLNTLHKHNMFSNM